MNAEETLDKRGNPVQEAPNMEEVFNKKREDKIGGKVVQHNLGFESEEAIDALKNRVEGGIQRINNDKNRGSEEVVQNRQVVVNSVNNKPESTIERVTGLEGPNPDKVPNGYSMNGVFSTLRYLQEERKKNEDSK